MSVHVRVRVGVETYAVPVEHVVEVAELGDVTRVPGTPPAVRGVRNLHGEVVPVFDLASVLGLAAGAPRRLLVAELDRRRAGFAVDDVVAVDDLPDPTEDTESSLLTGAALVDEDLVGFVDVATLFAAVEAAGT